MWKLVVRDASTDFARYERRRPYGNVTKGQKNRALYLGVLSIIGVLLCRGPGSKDHLS